MPTYRLFSAAAMGDAGSGTRSMLDHHVAKLNVPQFDLLADSQPPVRLYRGQPAPPPAPVVVAAAATEGGGADGSQATTTTATTAKPDQDARGGGKQPAAAATEQVDEGAIAPFGNALKQKQRSAAFKRKTRLYTATPADYEEQRKLRRREAWPWLLEDDSGEVGFVGRLEGDMSQNYVLFVYEVCALFNVHIYVCAAFIFMVCVRVEWWFHGGSGEELV